MDEYRPQSSQIIKKTNNKQLPDFVVIFDWLVFLKPES